MSASFTAKLVRRTITGAATFLIGCAGTAVAADYPNHSIRMIVPFATGGSTDLVGRLIAEYVGRELGQSIVVENKGGAGGAVGAEQIARATPDGYTIGMATVSTHGSNPAIYKGLKYDPVKDFAPISNVLGIPSVFAVNPKVPAKDMKEFIALAKADPMKYSFASPGIGSLGHANIENFMMLSDIKMLHVPYRGAGPAVNDALAGQIDALTDNLSSTLPHLLANRLRPLAVLGAERSALLPDVPTYAELGFPEMGTGGWFGLVAPANTPKEIIDRLNQAVRKAAANPEFQERAHKAGGTLMTNSPEEFAKDIDAALIRYAKVAKAANIQAN
ncbi:tripartite tricarboxylate transporter substrate binding protein BugE [Candidimonas sp. SYP-B2681]|uniref:tripartite tricarboxylate transporter substrate binding protein BugE n=1 Tax=Candidimonas sp. SYP-B2681 TaxID=2497686 RepID=UPI000F896A7D|nr:tripartite tricarboxylate transporter substrate binding protein BugE [Candidimonas sp. SYP-B2681]RTZ45565.1 tripartite tricarboxylate transporter substrate binding protein BugE [Candidimonas sp. SYP-B2681]